MNGSGDGGFGVYGSVVVGALMELGDLLNKPGQKRRGAGRSWKGVVLVLAVIVTPVVLLLASGNGF